MHEINSPIPPLGSKPLADFITILIAIIIPTRPRIPFAKLRVLVVPNIAIADTNTPIVIANAINPPSFAPDALFLAIDFMKPRIISINTSRAMNPLSRVAIFMLAKSFAIRASIPIDTARLKNPLIFITLAPFLTAILTKLRISTIIMISPPKPFAISTRFILAIILATIAKTPIAIAKLKKPLRLTETLLVSVLIDAINTRSITSNTIRPPRPLASVSSFI